MYARLAVAAILGRAGESNKVEQSLLIYFICFELKGGMDVTPFLISVRHFRQQHINL